jgi:hypothetical protein
MQEWTFRKASALLIGSVLVTLCLSVGGYLLSRHLKTKRLCEERYKVSAIIQTGPEKEVLKTTYLAELLGLSADKPKNLYAIDVAAAQKALLASPLIVKAEVQRQAPSTLYIDYEVRKPIAYLADYRNVAIDREGYLFPIDPFFSPQEMPEIYLGLPPFGAPEDSFGREGGRWKSPLKNRYLSMALELLQTLEGSSWKEGLKVKRIDVSNGFAPTLGRREIVLFTEEEISFKKNNQPVSFIFPKILRLASKEYATQLKNFFALRKTMLEDYRKQLENSDQGGKFAPRIIDLRISQLAFVENSKGDGS